MLKSFIAWLEGHLVDAGVISLVDATLTILALGGLLSVLLGGSAFKAAAIVVVVLAQLGLLAVLTTDRKDRRRSAERDRTLLGRYCRIIRDRSDYSWRVISWDETVVVGVNGDTKGKVDVKVVVESEYLDFFRLCIGAIWNQPEKYRRRVKANARSLQVDGVGGTRYATTSSWIADGRMEFIAHFGSSLRMGEKLDLTVDLDWPGKCIPLVMYREPEEFRVRFRQGIEYVRYVVVLPFGMDAYYEPIGFTADQSGFEIESRISSAGGRELVFTAYDVPPRKLVGMRLDLK